MKPIFSPLLVQKDISRLDFGDVRVETRVDFFLNVNHVHEYDRTACVVLTCWYFPWVAKGEFLLFVGVALVLWSFNIAQFVSPNVIYRTMIRSKITPEQAVTVNFRWMSWFLVRYSRQAYFVSEFPWRGRSSNLRAVCQFSAVQRVVHLNETGPKWGK